MSIALAALVAKKIRRVLKCSKKQLFKGELEMFDEDCSPKGLYSSDPRPEVSKNVKFYNSYLEKVRRAEDPNPFLQGPHRQRWWQKKYVGS